MSALRARAYAPSSTALLSDEELRILGPKQGPSLASICRPYLTAIDLLEPTGSILKAPDIDRAWLVAASAQQQPAEADNGTRLAAALTELTGETVQVEAVAPAPAPKQDAVRALQQSQIQHLQQEVDRLKQQLHDLADAVGRGDVDQADAIREALATDYQRRANSAEFLAKGPPPDL